jgi:hypothetical protein
MRMKEVEELPGDTRRDRAAEDRSKQTFHGLSYARVMKFLPYRSLNCSRHMCAKTSIMIASHPLKREHATHRSEPAYSPNNRSVR